MDVSSGGEWIRSTMGVSPSSLISVTAYVLLMAGILAVLAPVLVIVPGCQYIGGGLVVRCSDTYWNFVIQAHLVTLAGGVIALIYSWLRSTVPGG